MKLRVVYESARLGMFLRGCRSSAIDVASEPPCRLAYLDGRHLYRGDPDARPPLAVFVHGLGSSVATWSPVLPGVARAVPVVAPDLPGYGRSRLPQGLDHVTFRQKVEAMHGFLDAISPDDPVQLIGQSMGGWLAARVAAERPDRVARLTLVNTAGVLTPQVYEQRALFSPTDRTELRRLWKSMWRRLPVTYYLLEDEYMRVTRLPTVRGFLDSVTPDDFLDPHLHEIAAPTLLIWGLADRLITPETIPVLRAGVPDIRVREIPDCGHIPQRECTRTFLRYLLPWLRGDEPPETPHRALHVPRAGPSSST